MSNSAREMTVLTLQLRRKTLEKLAQRAAEAGQDVGDFASRLIEHFAIAPTLIQSESEESRAMVEQSFEDISRPHISGLGVG